ncbi:hypothetical protein LOC54_09770 [Acetobacter sp. AN02]|uniref:hypothetical protein n=1 Tax=Acetobacter sp. AN02 TaxID=2894186 RepID=UPI0024344D79|nr:hypothetical protein [Acetobacter sp. AN02]MDG6095386.1 hypothetical protein [Acetobacter sp. AN02]
MMETAGAWVTRALDFFAYKMTQRDVPVIGIRELIVMHVLLLLFCGGMAWIDWSLTG